MRYHDEALPEHQGDSGRNALPVLRAAENLTVVTTRPVKKIPRELRRTNVNHSLEPSWHQRMIQRLKEDSQFLRSVIQAVFIAVTGLAILTGNWQNAIRKEECQKRFQQLDSPAYQHFRGKVPSYGPND